MRRLTRLSWPPDARLNLWVMAVAYTVFGLSMIFQSHRWETTPAYHVLLLIFRAQVWGGLFLASGISMGLAARWFHRRRVVYSALMLAFALTAGWMLAFIARYLTSPNTTPETWVSWTVFGYLLVKAAVSVDIPDVPDVLPGPEIEEFRQAVDDALTTAAEDQRKVLANALAAWADRSHDAVSRACANFGVALRAIVPAGAMPSGDPAKIALEEARNAMKRAEEAYARATGVAAPPPGGGNSESPQ